MKLYLKTTTISPERTSAEIASELAEGGATQVLTEYGPRHEVTALHYRIKIKDGTELPFRVPVRPEAIYDLLKSQMRHPTQAKLARAKEQAPAIAWRQALYLTRAQLAYVQSGQAPHEQLFLGFLQVAGKRSLFDAIAEGGFQKALMAGPDALGPSKAQVVEAEYTEEKTR